MRKNVTALRENPSLPAIKTAEESLEMVRRYHKNNKLIMLDPAFFNIPGIGSIGREYVSLVVQDHSRRVLGNVAAALQQDIARAKVLLAANLREIADSLDQGS